MKLERQRTRTLAMWLMELNSWRWPKRIPDPESPNTEGYPRRRKWIRDIETILAWRMVKQLREDGEIQ